MRGLISLSKQNTLISHSFRYFQANSLRRNQFDYYQTNQYSIMRAYSTNITVDLVPKNGNISFKANITPIPLAKVRVSYHFYAKKSCLNNRKSFKSVKRSPKKNPEKIQPFFSEQKFSWQNFSHSKRGCGSSNVWPRAPKNTTQFLITDCEERESAERELLNESAAETSSSGGGVQPRAFSSCSLKGETGTRSSDSDEDLNVDEDSEFAVAYNDITWERIKTLSRDAVSHFCLLKKILKRYKFYIF